MLTRLRQASIGAQFVLLFGVVGIVLALSAWYCMYLVVGIALEDLPVDERARIAELVRWMVASVVGLTTLSLAAAAAVVRGSLRHSLDGIDDATGAIARGDFAHRVRSQRRDELGRLAHSIDRAAERLEALDRSREELVARVSHELRTPLTIIRCQAYSLATALRDEAQRDRVAVIEGEVERLSTMLEDLLLASTLRARPLHLVREPVPIGELALRVEERFAARARAHGRMLNIVVDDGEARIDGDLQRIEQVLANLVANAIAHASTDGRIDVALRCLPGSVRVSVANRGPVIPPAELPTLFEPFVQGSSPTGSVGLGLAIANDLVAAHGAELHVRSRDERTEFWFDLPRDLAQPIDPPTMIRRPGRLPMRVGSELA